MNPYYVELLLRNNEKYLFTILTLATITIVGFTIEKAYPQSDDSQLNDSQLNGPAMDSQKPMEKQHHQKINLLQKCM